MKTIIVLMLANIFLLPSSNQFHPLAKIKEKQEKADFCFVIATNYTKKIVYVSKTLDYDDFEHDMWTLLDATKNALNYAVGSTAYEYTSGITIYNRDRDNNILTNKYDSDQYRKYIIEDLKKTNFKILDLTIQ
ncbi:hypothetical protein ACX0HA_03995 [Flavobacterium hauense]